MMINYLLQPLESSQVAGLSGSKPMTHEWVVVVALALHQTGT